MTEETNGAGLPDAEDTAAVLAHAVGGEKTYLQPQAEEPVEAVQDETPGDDAAAETETPAPEPKRTSVQDRIDELTRARREAEREAAHWKRLASEGRQPEPQPTAERPQDAEPDPADFQYGEADPAFIRELGKHTARQEFMRLTREQEQRATVRSVEQSWTDRQEAFAKEHPDFFEKVAADDLTITPVMADAIKTSEEGARVAYHLAQNPDEARRIAALNPLAQVRELGRLEAKLAVPAEAAPQPQDPPLKTVSDAPAPAPQARGLKGQFKPPADTSDFAAFERAFVRRDG